MIARMRENLTEFPKACARAISFQARMTSPDLRPCCGFAIAAFPTIVARTSPTQAVDTIRPIRDMASPDVVGHSSVERPHPDSTTSARRLRDVHPDGRGVAGCRRGGDVP